MCLSAVYRRRSSGRSFQLRAAELTHEAQVESSRDRPTPALHEPGPDRTGPVWLYLPGQTEQLDPDEELFNWTEYLKNLQMMFVVIL